MPLTNYTELKASVASWLNRDDLASRIPEFIALFEAQARRALQTRQMQKRATANLTGQFLSLPSDFKALVNVQLNTSPVVKLEYASADYLDEIRGANPQGGTPRFYTIFADQLEVAPVPDRTVQIEILYFQQLPALSDTVASNWLLLNHPDAYLYGSLLQAAPYLKEDERVTGWDAALTAIFDQIRVDDERATKSGVPLKLRVRPYGVKR